MMTRELNFPPMEEERNAYRIFVGKPEGRRHFEELGVDGNIILKWILRIL
jgi:hypothetical protein